MAGLEDFFRALVGGSSAQTPQQPPVAGMPQQPSGLTGVISNPLVQGALGAYLSGISQPRYKGWGNAIGQGGLGGLNAFNQAELQQTQLPMQQAQTEQAQLQTQALKRQLQPLPPDVKANLDELTTSAGDPQEKAYFKLLGAQAQQGLITPEELNKSLESWNEQKRMADLMRAQAAQTSAGYVAQLMGGMGFAPPPAAGAAPAAGTPPPATAASSMGGVPAGTVFQTNVAGKSVTAVTDPGTGETFYLEGGKWQPLPHP